MQTEQSEPPRPVPPLSLNEQEAPPERTVLQDPFSKRRLFLLIFSIVLAVSFFGLLARPVVGGAWVYIQADRAYQKKDYSAAQQRYQTFLREYYQQIPEFISPLSNFKAGILFRLASIYLVNEDNNDARRLLEEIAEKYPGYIQGKPTYDHALATTYIFDDPQQSIKILENINEEHSGYGKDYPTFYYQLGLAYVVNGDIYRGGANFSAFLALNPPAEEVTPQQHQIMAITFASTEKSYVALQQFQALPSDVASLKKLEINPEAYYQALAIAYLGQEKYQQAVSTADRLLEFVATNSAMGVTAHIVKERSYKGLRQDDLSEQEKKILRDSPTLQHGLFALAYFSIFDAEALLESGRGEDLMGVIQNVTREGVTPLDTAVSLTGIAKVFRKYDLIDEVIPFLQAIIDRYPYYPPAQIQMGSILLDREDYERAAMYYQQILDFDPFYSDALTDLCGAKYSESIQKNDASLLQEAQKDCETALRFNPGYWITLDNLGLVYKAQKNYEAAVNTFFEVIEVKSDEVWPYVRLARTYRAMKNLTSARNMLQNVFNRGLLKSAQAEDAAAVYHELGLVNFDEGKLDEAIEAYSTATQLDPKDADPYVDLGWAYHNKGQFDRAISMYTTALQINPDHALGHNNLGYTFAIQGRIDQAVAEFEKALSIDPSLKIAQENVQIYKKR